MAIKTETINKSLSFALSSPRVTEKASLLSVQNVYTFNVPKDFNKIEVMKAVEAIYKVKPIQVRMVTIPAKNFMFRGKKGVKGGGKKAMVFLKKGDKIEFV